MARHGLRHHLDAIANRLVSRGADGIPLGVMAGSGPLGKDTEAFDLLFGQVTHSRPMDIGAEAWIDHRASEQYRVREHSLRIADDTVLTMLWWKDEAQIVDLT